MGYWPDFNLESVFVIKNIFIMKNVTDFPKTVETGVDPCLNRVLMYLLFSQRFPKDAEVVGGYKITGAVLNRHYLMSI